MKRVVLNYLVIAALAISAAFTSCGGVGGSGSYKIKMTTEAGSDVSFSLEGSGIATVNWGDGSEKVTLTLPASFIHEYQNSSLRTITINGDNITGLSSNNHRGLTSLDVSRCTEMTTLICIWGSLKSLDVSKNTALTELNCSSNQITSLDVSKNTALIKVICDDNQLSSSAINALFGTLHSNSGGKGIYVNGNPGTDDCDRSIAKGKGWTFNGIPLSDAEITELVQRSCNSYGCSKEETAIHIQLIIERCRESEKESDRFLEAYTIGQSLTYLHRIEYHKEPI
jgi:hypothetical protein